MTMVSYFVSTSPFSFKQVPPRSNLRYRSTSKCACMWLNCAQQYFVKDEQKCNTHTYDLVAAWPREELPRGVVTSVHSRWSANLDAIWKNIPCTKVNTFASKWRGIALEKPSAVGKRETTLLTCRPASRDRRIHLGCRCTGVSTSWAGCSCRCKALEDNIACTIGDSEIEYVVQLSSFMLAVCKLRSRNEHESQRGKLPRSRKQCMRGNHKVTLEFSSEWS